MRCGCPNCGSYMIQSESLNFGCVCPECLSRCRACMGTDTVVRREDLARVALLTRFFETETEEETDAVSETEALKPEDFID